MTSISDNFVRVNGALGSNWATPVPCNPDFGGWTGTPSGNVLINSNGVGGDATNGADCFCLWNGGQTFGNDQYAQATIKTIASPTATLSISAASQSGSNTTYTYTVSAGSVTAPVSGGFLYVIISGMADSGNNGNFVATTFGAGTFTVANASGVTRSAQSGVGYCASDSGAGVGVRLSGTSAATMNGYYFHVGTNSFNGDGRKAYYELWKIVNGAGSTLCFADGTTALSKVVPSVGDVIGLTAIGSQITCYYNGIILTGGNLPANGIFQVTDTAIAGGGGPGLFTFAISGANEYDYALWTSGSQAIPGNNGTSLNNFMAGDISTIPQLATDNFKETGTYGQVDLVPYANGDLHTANANWAYEGSSNFNVTTSVVYCGAGANPAFAYRSDISAPTNDQWAEVICHNTAVVGTQNYGPAVRVASAAQTAYFCQLSTSSVILAKYVAGVYTSLGSVAAAATGDSIRITAIGTALNVYKNGALIIGPITDSSIASGNVGMFGAGSASSNGFSKWAGGSMTELTTATNYVTDTGQTVLLDPTNGAFSTAPNLTTGWTQIYENTLTWGNDQYAQATQTYTAVLNILTGPQVRAAAGGTGYLFVTASTAAIDLYKIVSGTATLLKQVSYAPQVNDVFRIEIQGSLITCKVNGTVKIALADLSLSSGKPGLFWNHGGSGIGALETMTGFSAGSLASISGSAGVASATVSYSGTATGTVTADGSGNYSITSLPNGSYTITPTLAGYTFTPANLSETVSAANITNANFTAVAVASNYSVPDCRVSPAGPNSSRTVNGTKIYDVQTSSNSAVPSTDSRAAGAPVACNTYPQNSRASGTFGPGE